ncbi:MAG TPA: hypothetical protein VJX74_10255, partial [Blastocatellia bacterium]|nr:hypothetical protein [Blastocatellia bacterium]
DFYNYEKLEVAQEMLRMRDRIGAARLILERTRMFETKWPVLHKVGDGRNREDTLPRKKP